MGPGAASGRLPVRLVPAGPCAMTHSPEIKAERLLQLSDDVARIAGSLAQLSLELGAPPRQSPPDTGSNEAAILLETVSWLVKARRNRASYLPAELFAEPAWDILLNLFQCDLAHEQVAVASACDAAAAPASTALRWLRTLEQQGLVLRRGHPLDPTKALVVLAPATRTALRRYCLEVVQTHRGRCR